MKKRLFALLLVGVLLVLLTACGDSNPVTDDLKFYMEDMNEIQSIHTDAIAAYNDYFSNEEATSDQLLKIMNSTVIPGFDDYIEKSGEIKPETEEVKEVKSIYDEYIGLQYDAMNMVAEAIANQDTGKLSEANDALSSANSKYSDYKGKVSVLATDNGISLVNEWYLFWNYW